MTMESIHPRAPYLRVLGTTVIVLADGAEVTLSATQRRLLARLAAADTPVDLSDLIDEVWGESAPRTARQAIHNQVSRIRALAGDEAVRTSDGTYTLGIEVDAEVFRAAAVTAEALAAAKDHAASYTVATDALELWQGEPLADIVHLAVASPRIEALHSTRIALTTTRLEAAIGAGHKNWALHEAEVLAGESPFDERRAALLARALLLHGRRVDALTLINNMRRRLRTELGLTAGPDLTQVETEILHPEAPPHEGRGRTGDVFVGRDGELRSLLAHIARDHPLLVHGEPGIGVSRLLLEARMRLHRLGVSAVLVRAEEYPHSAVSLLEDLLHELDIPIPGGMTVFSVLQRYVESLSPENPLVLLVDDAQFLGPSVAQVLRSAATSPGIRLVLAAHISDLGFEGIARIALPSLTPADVATIARSRGRHSDHELLFAHCGGNPALLTALLNSFVDGDPIPQIPPASRELTALTQRLIDPLDSQVRRDVHLAAVAGSGYPKDAFDHIHWPRTPQFPDTLVEWTAEDTLRFRHEAVRTNLYLALPRGQILEMHYALGEAARRVGAPPGTFAHHLLEAAEVDPLAAIDAAVAAARDAARLGAHADSAWWLQRARTAEAMVPPKQGLALRIEHADSLRLSGDPTHLQAALEACTEALALADEELIAQAAYVLLQLGGSSSAGALDPRISKVTDLAIAAISQANLKALVQGSASLAFSMTGNAAKCRDLFSAAEANATDEATRARVLPFAYLALGMPTDLPQRERYAREVVGIGERSNDPVALFEGLHLQFTVSLQQADGAGVRRSLDRMRAIVAEVGDVGRRWSVLYCMATVAELDGDLAASEELSHKAHALFAPVSPERAAAALQSALLPLRIRQGRLAELLPITAAMVDSQPGIPAWHAAHALVVTAAGGEKAEARSHLRLALERSEEDFTWLASHVIGGRAAAATADPSLIAAYRERLTPWADLVCWQGTGSYGPVAEVLALLAEAADDGEAAARHRKLAVRLGARLRG